MYITINIKRNILKWGFNFDRTLFNKFTEVQAKIKV